MNADLHAWPGASPGASSVVDYLRQFFSFNFEWHPYAFHSDELCAHHHGKLIGDWTNTGNHIGDPHTHTVNGKAFDFQSVGEFTLLRDGDRMEVQVRQTPVATQHPITDDYSGLTACVSIITAVAARIGRHRVAMQPGREGRLVQFYLDGKPTKLSPEGIDLDAHRVSAFDANGETGLRIDYEDGSVVTATPSFWNAHSVWYIDVSVSNTPAHEGVMGIVPKDSWLPRLSNGTTVGPKPASLHDRYAQLYQTFADSWRVTDATSLFVYAPGTSTKTFTDVEWPAGKPPCKLKPEFQIPGVQVHKGMPLADAEKVCAAVKTKDLHANCVFDVATTGDETFVRGYVLAQDLRLYGTSVHIAGYDAPIRSDRRLQDATQVDPSHRVPHTVIVIATVLPLDRGRPKPTGQVTLVVDGVPMNRPVELDGRGRASIPVIGLKPGKHRIRAVYSGAASMSTTAARARTCSVPSMTNSRR